jgi:hypothetical protein
VNDDGEDGLLMSDRFEERFKALEDRVELEAGVRAAADRDLSAITQRIDAANTLLQALAENQSNHYILLSSHSATLNLLDRRTIGLSGQFAGLDSKVTVLDGRVGALDAKVEVLGNQVVAMDGRVAALDGRVAALDSKVDAMGVDVHELRGDVASLSERMQAMDGRFDVMDGKFDVVIELLRRPERGSAPS